MTLPSDLLIADLQKADSDLNNILRYYGCDWRDLIKTWLRRVLRKDLLEIVNHVDNGWLQQMKKFRGSKTQKSDLRRFIQKDSSDTGDYIGNDMETVEMMFLRVSILFGSDFTIVEGKSKFEGLDVQRMWAAYAKLVSLDVICCYSMMRQALVSDQQAACYVIKEDNFYRGIQKACDVWNWSGGVGFNASNLPENIAIDLAECVDHTLVCTGGSQGKSDGLAMFMHVDQWSIFELLQRKSPNDINKLHRITFGLLMNDEFMRRFENGEDWYFFKGKRPSSFFNLSGEEYSRAYSKCVGEYEKSLVYLPYKIVLDALRNYEFICRVESGADWHFIKLPPSLDPSGVYYSDAYNEYVENFQGSLVSKPAKVVLGMLMREEFMLRMLTGEDWYFFKQPQTFLTLSGVEYHEAYEEYVEENGESLVRMPCELVLGMLGSDEFMYRFENDQDWDFSQYKKGAAPMSCRAILEMLVSDDLVSRLKEGRDWKFANVSGLDYSQAYAEYVANMKSMIRMPCRNVLEMLFNHQLESGLPYVIFIDSMNELRSQVDPVTCSNLCCEIALSNGPNGEDIATCNIAAINVMHLISDDGKAISLPKIKSLMDVMVPSLTASIVSSVYSDRFPNQRLNLRDAPLGMGFMGLASLFSHFKIDYNSIEAEHLAGFLSKYAYYYALMASIELGRRTGTYCESRKALHWQMFNERTKSTIMPSQYKSPVPIEGEDILLDDSVWEDATSARRNVTLLSHMPGSHSSLIFGVSQGILPINTLKSIIFRSGYSIFQEVDGFFGSYGDQVSQISLNRVAAAIQKFTDQSMSLSRRVPQTQTFDDFVRWLVDGWRRGLKTAVYYTEVNKKKEDLVYCKTSGGVQKLLFV